MPTNPRRSRTRTPTSSSSSIGGWILHTTGLDCDFRAISTVILNSPGGEREDRRRRRQWDAILPKRSVLELHHRSLQHRKRYLQVRDEDGTFRRVFYVPEALFADWLADGARPPPFPRWLAPVPGRWWRIQWTAEDCETVWEREPAVAVGREGRPLSDPQLWATHLPDRFNGPIHCAMVVRAFFRLHPVGRRLQPPWGPMHVARGAPKGCSKSPPTGAPTVLSASRPVTVGLGVRPVGHTLCGTPAPHV